MKGTDISLLHLRVCGTCNHFRRNDFVSYKEAGDLMIRINNKGVCDVNKTAPPVEVDYYDIQLCFTEEDYETNSTLTTT